MAERGKGESAENFERHSEEAGEPTIRSESVEPVENPSSPTDLTYQSPVEIGSPENIPTASRVEVATKGSRKEWRNWSDLNKLNGIELQGSMTWGDTEQFDG